MQKTPLTYGLHFFSAQCRSKWKQPWPEQRILTAEQSQVFCAARLGGVNDPNNEMHSLRVAHGSTLQLGSCQHIHCM